MTGPDIGASNRSHPVENAGLEATATAATEWVVGCDREGHPKNYAHAHPYITDLCSTDQHRTCQLLARYVSCDCGCHRD